MFSNKGECLKIGTLLAGSDLSSKQYYCVDIASDGAVDSSVSDGNLVGVVQNAPVAGEVCEIVNKGITLAAVGGTIAAGGELEVVSGRVKAWATSGHKVGIALEAGAVGEVVSILLY